MVARPANVRTGTSEAQPGWLTTGAAAPKPRGRLPSFGTLIFLGFLAITGFRLVGEFVRGLATETPGVTSPAEPGQAAAPGSIVFGTNSDGNCGVIDSAPEFAEGSDISWSALLSTEQAPDAEVVVIVRRDGAEVDREPVPPDESFGTWSVLCSGKPVGETRAGLYRIEVWDSTVTVLHAAGEYRLTAP